MAQDMRVLNPNLLEILSHELINSVGLISMNFELLTDALTSQQHSDSGHADALSPAARAISAEDHAAHEILRVDASLKETIELLQLLNACAISLQRGERNFKTRLELLIPILKWHVKRFGLHGVKVQTDWLTPTSLVCSTDEVGIFERGEMGLPMAVLAMMSLKDRMKLNEDASIARFNFDDLHIEMGAS